MYLSRTSKSFKGRQKDSRNVLTALMPGARINKKNNRITINVGTSNETLVFNIGGTRFETYRSTLNRIPCSPLADEKFLQKHYREDKGDYFFDREPDVFKAILNYLRTGELHLPAWLCGASTKNELHFWGVEEDEIQECCWTSYNSWTTTLEALKRLEKDMKGSLGQGFQKTKGPTTKWTEFCQKGWTLMNNPRSSGWAKVFGIISMLFVLLSIFSFCAETHETFQIHPHKREPVFTLHNSTFDNTTTDNVHNVTYNVTNAAYNITPGVNGTGANGESDVLIHPSLFIIDVICVTYFILEFIARFTICPNKLRFFLLPMTMVDVAALLPDIIEISYRLATSNFYSRETIAVIPVLRVTRIFRFFRLMRHIPGLWILLYTLKASLKELMLMMLFLCIGMLVYASLIYFADDRATFSSIPQGFWWALITMTTVGYGDMYPVTKLGYLVGSFTAVSGLLMIGFTVPILVNNFVLYYSHTQSSLEREERKVKRQKQIEAEARKRKPSLISMSFGSRFQKKDDEGIQMSVLASMADDVSKGRNSCEKKGGIIRSDSEFSDNEPVPEDKPFLKDTNGNTNFQHN